MDKEQIKFILRRGIRLWLSRPTITRDGNTFIRMGDKWLLVSGPWHKLLLSLGTPYPIIAKMKPLNFTLEEPDWPPALSCCEYARWSAIEWVNITQSMRCSALRNYPFLRGEAKTFVAFYCEDGHLPLTLDDRPIEWIY